MSVGLQPRDQTNPKNKGASARGLFLNSPIRARADANPTFAAYNASQRVACTLFCHRFSRSRFGFSRSRSDAVQINYLRDIPLGLGLIALCVGIFTNGIEIKIDPNSPQWLCRPMLLIIGTLLICFSFVGQLTPQ
jgi:hypothetical protein